MNGGMIAFGYRLESGKIVIDKENSDIIKQIFYSYISGKTLKEISDELNMRGIKYKDGKRQWNKNIICRIVENEKYCGNEEYPPIIDTEIFKTANDIKQSKKHIKIEISNEIGEISKKIYCFNCNSKYRRIEERRRTGERWICRNGCKCIKRISDELIISEITKLLNMLILNNGLAKSDSIQTYNPSLEIIKLNNEINRMIHQKDIKFNEVKDIILECASKKYDCCTLDKSGTVTETIITRLKAMKAIEKAEDLIHIKDIVSKILIDTAGTVSIELTNGKIIKELN